MTDTATQTESPSQGANKPAAEYRYGNVKAVIWANRSDFGVNHSVKLSRSYTKDGKWFETDYLGRKDIFKAIEALRDAGRFLHSGSKTDQAAADSNESDAPPGQYN